MKIITKEELASSNRRINAAADLRGHGVLLRKDCPLSSEQVVALADLVKSLTASDGRRS